MHSFFFQLVYTSEKPFCLNDINSSVMPRLDENKRLRAIGMLQAGLAQHVVASLYSES
jgi:hypothetical protein